MKVLYLAVALAVLASPAAGETRKGKDSSVRKPSAAVHLRQAEPRRAAQLPCAGRNWNGCLGRDPDPRIGMMIHHDSNDY